MSSLDYNVTEQSHDGRSFKMIRYHFQTYFSGIMMYFINPGNRYFIYRATVTTSDVRPVPCIVALIFYDRDQNEHQRTRKNIFRGEW